MRRVRPDTASRRPRLAAIERILCGPELSLVSYIFGVYGTHAVASFARGHFYEQQVLGPLTRSPSILPAIYL